MLRSLHLQKDASAYNYICPGAQLKVRVLLSDLEVTCLKIINAS